MKMYDAVISHDSIAVVQLQRQAADEFVSWFQRRDPSTGRYGLALLAANRELMAEAWAPTASLIRRDPYGIVEPKWNGHSATTREASGAPRRLERVPRIAESEVEQGTESHKQADHDDLTETHKILLSTDETPNLGR
ncbi:hypothetical protein GA707_20120 [Nostocoides sp. F2B08]|uniref:hypothetical protein n=1 Tax=Nostocoides sp. F2B08 TaxID=2653936 RepID=UPI0012633AE8|nr:hypothetical protein [Tetrasphaera sp. F2B08]KAB7739785.1 hypothetical protein GA707_20120 [Tetrasphaera sp. F2B08]